MMDGNIFPLFWDLKDDLVTAGAILSCFLLSVVMTSQRCEFRWTLWRSLFTFSTFCNFMFFCPFFLWCWEAKNPPFASPNSWKPQVRTLHSSLLHTHFSYLWHLSMETVETWRIRNNPSLVLIISITQLNITLKLIEQLECLFFRCATVQKPQNFSKFQVGDLFARSMRLISLKQTWTNMSLFDNFWNREFSGFCAS